MYFPVSDVPRRLSELKSTDLRDVQPENANYIPLVPVISSTELKHTSVKDVHDLNPLLNVYVEFMLDSFGKLIEPSFLQFSNAAANVFPAEVPIVVRFRKFTELNDVHPEKALLNTPFPFISTRLDMFTSCRPVALPKR